MWCCYSTMHICGASIQPCSMWCCYSTMHKCGAAIQPCAHVVLLFNHAM
jgi:hypothetical protein